MTWRGNLDAEARSQFNSISEIVYRAGNEIKGGSAGKQPTAVEIEYAEQSTSGIRHVQRSYPESDGVNGCLLRLGTRCRPLKKRPFFSEIPQETLTHILGYELK